ncbi:MAG: hypothetical protein ABIG73_02620, partial [Patescibacteria group bacterium]
MFEKLTLSVGIHGFRRDFSLHGEKRNRNFVARRLGMKTREELRAYLMGKMRSSVISDFTQLFTILVFGGGTKISNPELLEYFKYLFEMTIEANRDDLAFNLLNKINATYHGIEEEVEKKKERPHFGDASKKANDKFFEFITSIYPTIACKKSCGRNEFAPVMQETRFQMLEYAAQRWEQSVCRESYAAFRFLIEAFETQEKREILDRILRPRVEKSFTKVESIEQWLSLCEKDPIPFEIQQLLVMARAKNGGPELAKHD